MLKVSVTSTVVRNQSGTGKVSQKPYSLNFQTAWFHTYDRDGTKNPFPEKVEIILDKNSDGAPLFYAAGDYQLHPNSIYVDQNGKLAIQPRLIPLQAAPVAKT